MRSDSVVQPASPSRTATPARANVVRDKHEPDDDVRRFRALMQPDGKPKQGDQAAGSPLAPNGQGKDMRQQALYALLQQQREATDAAVFTVPGRGEDDGGDTGQRFSDQADASSATVDPMAVQPATHMVIDSMAPAIAAPPGATLAPGLAQLIERHVKQMLVSDRDALSSAQQGEIMLRLKDDVLPGTDLWLSRTDGGWKLRADTRSADAYRTLIESAPSLIERFAGSNLGELDVDPVFHT
jgi:hypothetical protein